MTFELNQSVCGILLIFASLAYLGLGTNFASCIYKGLAYMGKNYKVRYKSTLCTIAVSTGLSGLALILGDIEGFNTEDIRRDLRIIILISTGAGAILAGIGLIPED